MRPSPVLRLSAAVVIAVLVCALAAASAGLLPGLTDPHAQEVAPKIVVTPIAE